MERIGWENDRGAYFINNLYERIEANEKEVTDEVKALSDADKAIADTIGKLTDLDTTSKTSVVSAINELFGIRLKQPFLNGNSYNLDNYNTYTDSGFYNIGSDVVNSPANWCVLIVGGGNGGGSMIQIAITSSIIYFRMYTGSPLAWSAWRKITSTTV